MTSGAEGLYLGKYAQLQVVMKMLRYMSDSQTFRTRKYLSYLGSGSKPNTTKTEVSLLARQYSALAVIQAESIADVDSVTVHRILTLSLCCPVQYVFESVIARVVK